MRQWMMVGVVMAAVNLGCWESSGNKRIPPDELPSQARTFFEHNTPGWTITGAEKGKMLWGDEYYDVQISKDGRTKTVRYRPDQTAPGAATTQPAK
jgi:hypothetical protein